MIDNKFLNEEKYQKAEKNVSLIALLVLIIGLCLGGFLIYRGVAKPQMAKVEELKLELENKRKELESKGISYDVFAKYTDGEMYDMKIITGALDPSFSRCEFDEYKNNPITKEYCSKKNSASEFASTSLIMIGAFICISSLMISISIFTFAKRRNILAFSAQQIMPVAKEAVNEMTPSVGKVAEEITKGIKKGLDDK